MLKEEGKAAGGGNVRGLREFLAADVNRGDAMNTAGQTREPKRQRKTAEYTERSSGTTPSSAYSVLVCLKIFAACANSRGPNLTAEARRTQSFWLLSSLGSSRLCGFMGVPFGLRLGRAEYSAVPLLPGTSSQAASMLGRRTAGICKR